MLKLNSLDALHEGFLDSINQVKTPVANNVETAKNVKKNMPQFTNTSQDRSGQSSLTINAPSSVSMVNNRIKLF